MADSTDGREIGISFAGSQEDYAEMLERISLRSNIAPNEVNSNLPLDQYGGSLATGFYLRRDNVYGSWVSNLVYLSVVSKNLSEEYMPSSKIKPMQVSKDTSFTPIPLHILESLVLNPNKQDRKWITNKIS